MDQATEAMQTTARKTDADSEGGNGGLGSRWGNFKNFIKEVREELRRVTWPSREEVYSTTLIVVFAVAFFGLFLWAADLLIGKGFEQITKWLS
jgi:preprotein translocase subunit SecE